MKRDLWWLVLSAPLALFLAWLTALPLLTCLLSGTAATIFLQRHLEIARARSSIALLTWAALLSLSTITAVLIAPAWARSAVPHGAAYWAEMQPYLFAAQGKEVSPAQFVPQHLLHLAAFALLASASAGWGALVLGAFLIGYMSYYVAQTMLLARDPALALVMGWHPWAVIRVVAFVLLGISLARLMRLRFDLARWWSEERRAIAFALGLWCCDLVLKLTLARCWSLWMRDWCGIAVPAASVWTRFPAG